MGHLFIRTKNILDVPHLRMVRVTFVQQKSTQKEICWNGLVAINFVNMMQNLNGQSVNVKAKARHMAVVAVQLKIVYFLSSIMAKHTAHVQLLWMEKVHIVPQKLIQKEFW